jgi:hypothetical protein
MRPFCALALALLLASCGKKEPPPSASAPTPSPITRKTEDVRTKAVPAPAIPHIPPPPDPVEPRLGLSANGSDVAEILPGWPLVLRLRIHAPLGASIALSERDGSWAGRVTIEGHPPLPALKPGPRPSGALALEGDAAGELVWTMSAAELDALPRGPLVIAARLEWKDAAFVQASARITLLPPPKQAPPAVDPKRMTVQVDAALARGETDEALTLVDASLAKRPQDPMLLGLRGKVLEASGRLKEAMAAYDQAVEQALRRSQPARNWSWRRDRVAVAIESKK